MSNSRVAARFLHPRPKCLRHQLLHSRPLSSTTSLPYPRKDSQDKDSINTEATEYSKSGTDDAAAANPQAAFDPNTPDPESEQEQAATKEDGTKTDANPLNASPANHEISKPRGGTEGGAQRGTEQKTSGGGSPGKGSKVR